MLSQLLSGKRDAEEMKQSGDSAYVSLLIVLQKSRPHPGKPRKKIDVAISFPLPYSLIPCAATLQEFGLIPPRESPRDIRGRGPCRNPLSPSCPIAISAFRISDVPLT